MESFLKKTFGEEKGKRIFFLTEVRLNHLRREAPKESAARNQILRRMLMPYIALFQILMEQGMER